MTFEESMNLRKQVNDFAAKHGLYGFVDAHSSQIVLKTRSETNSGTVNFTLDNAAKIGGVDIALEEAKKELTG